MPAPATITQKLFAKYAADPAAFRADLVVDVDGQPRKFGDVMDPWQRADFAALDPALTVCNGRASIPQEEGGAEGPEATQKLPTMRAYLERPRGHSKTTDLAVTCCWALAFAARPIRGYAFAADKDQAGLLKDAMGTVVRLNPWLGTVLDVQRNAVLNQAKGHPGAGSTLEIFTSDVASSYGILPDLIIADELTHWEGDGSLWHSIISSAAKRSNCLLAVITNAGFHDSWQWQVREAARTEPTWHFSRLDGPQASWMTPARLAEQRKMLPPVAYLRLWENQWSSGGGDALTPADIDAAFSDVLAPLTGKAPGWLYVGGIDLGLTRDCSAVVVLAVPDRRWGKIRLAHHKLWRPTLGKKIDLREMEAHVLAMDAQCGLEFCAFDPWQAELLAARLEADHGRRARNRQRRAWAKPWMQEVQPTAQNLRAQATLVIETFNDRRFESFHCEPLKQDLYKLRVEEKSYGIRLVSPRDETGHGDTFSAFALALLVGHELGNKRPMQAGVGDVGGDGLTPLQRHMARVQREQEEIRAERERLNKQSEYDYLWTNALKEAGAWDRLGQ